MGIIVEVELGVERGRGRVRSQCALGVDDWHCAQGERMVKRNGIRILKVEEENENVI